MEIVHSLLYAEQSFIFIDRPPIEQMDDQARQQNYPEEKPKENREIMDVHKSPSLDRVTHENAAHYYSAAMLTSIDGGTGWPNLIRWHLSSCFRPRSIPLSRLVPYLSKRSICIASGTLRLSSLPSQLSLSLPGWRAGKRDPGSDGLRSLLRECSGRLLPPRR